MHIPSEMLSGSVCPVTAVLAAGGVAVSAYALVTGKSKIPSTSKFALTSAAVFALQMLNYPIWDGISGHLIGGVFAASILGAPAAVLSLAIVLILQTLMFADGGILMLGANVFNMAVIGAGLGGLIKLMLEKKNVGESTAIGLAAFASVELAVLAVCVELLASGKGNFSIFVTLLGVHTALAMCEGCATVALSSLIKKSETSGAKKGVFALSLLTIVALMISPFASAFPDGFEWTMKNFALLPDAPNFTNAPFIDYVVPAISNDVVSGVVAGFIGVFVTMLVSFGVAKILPTKA